MFATKGGEMGIFNRLGMELKSKSISRKSSTASVNFGERRFHLLQSQSHYRGN